MIKSVLILILMSTTFAQSGSDDSKMASDVSKTTFRLSGAYDIGLHLGKQEDSNTNNTTIFDNTVTFPLKNWLANGNGISFDASLIMGGEEGATSRSIYGLRFSTAKYTGQAPDEENQFVTSFVTKGSTAYYDQELKVTTITPYFGIMGGEGSFKGYATIGLTIINYEWQFNTEDIYLELDTGIGGHIGIGADLQNMAGTGIGLNAEIGFQIAFTGNKQISEDFKASNPDWSVLYTHHMFTVRAGIVYTLDFM